MLVSTTTAAAGARALDKTRVNPFSGLSATEGQVDVPYAEGANVNAILNPATGEFGYSIGYPITGQDYTETNLAGRAAVDWAGALTELPDTGTVDVGTWWLWQGKIVKIIGAGFNRAVWGGDPEQYVSLASVKRDPWVVLPWAITGQFTAYMKVNEITGMPDRCTHNGETWESRRNTNTWEPPASPADTDRGWLQVSNTPAPWVHIGNEGYPVGWQVTHNGKLWQNPTEGTFWEPGVAIWTDMGAHP